MHDRSDHQQSPSSSGGVGVGRWMHETGGGADTERSELRDDGIVNDGGDSWPGRGRVSERGIGFSCSRRAVRHVQRRTATPCPFLPSTKRLLLSHRHAHHTLFISSQNTHLPHHFFTNILASFTPTYTQPTHTPPTPLYYTDINSYLFPQGHHHRWTRVCVLFLSGS